MFYWVFYGDGCFMVVGVLLGGCFMVMRILLGEFFMVMGILLGECSWGLSSW